MCLFSVVLTQSTVIQNELYPLLFQLVKSFPTFNLAFHTSTSLSCSTKDEKSTIISGFHLQKKKKTWISQMPSSKIHIPLCNTVGMAGKLQELPGKWPNLHGNTQLQNKKIKCLGRTSKVQAIFIVGF